MKKLIKLTESDLTKIVKRVLMESKLITEETYDQLIEKIYQDIISAVSTFGWTNKGKVYDSFNQLKSTKEFYSLVSKFKDGRTGYKRLTDMFQEEYDGMDREDIEKLRELFKKKFEIIFNVDWVGRDNDKLNLAYPKITWVYKPDLQDNTIPNLQSCKSKWESKLSEAKKFWLNWLANPITKEKFKKNYENERMTDQSINVLFGMYQKGINESYLYFYNDKTNNSFASVNRLNAKRIHINCAMNDSDPLGTLIHEMQHLLYHIKPLNPKKQITQLFVNNTTKKETPDDIIKSDSNSSIGNESKILNTNIKNASEKLSIETLFLKNWYNRSKEDVETSDDPEYSCRETEKMSNIMTIRNLLNIKPGQNITSEMLKPYISFQKQHTDVSWLLNCWALNGFEDLDKFLNKLNSLAQKEFDKTNSNSIDMSQSGINKG